MKHVTKPLSASTHASVAGKLLSPSLCTLALLLACGANSAAAQKPSAGVVEARVHEGDSTDHPASAPQLLFGALPVSTHSLEARSLVEKALDEYENESLEESIADSRKATEKDPQFALAYALWAFAAQREQPATAQLAKATALAGSAPAGEQLLVRWMIATQSSDLLPAISLMNDLLQRFPDNKHVLYLAGEWLYSQQDYDRSRKLFEKALQNDPKFPPSLNMLGYAYIETGDPDPGKAKAALQRYAALLPNHPNPHDSLGEVSRYAGDDEGSLVEYRKALAISPGFFTSQLGIGETLTLMGRYEEARAEIDKAMTEAPASRDRLHVEFQKALTRFWEGQPAQGRAELSALEAKALEANDGYARFDIGLGRALLAASADDELTQLSMLESAFSNPFSAMAEGDRHRSQASILQEEVRVLSLGGKVESAQDEIQELESLSRDSRDAFIENCYESARGFVFYANGEYSSAVDELASDPQNPLVARQIVLAYEKLGNAAAAEVSRNRLKYLRADTPQWFLVSQPPRR
jgi:tetratricopeptide (TPR) repeat protein